MVVGMQHQQQQPHASTVLEDATTPCAAPPQPKQLSPLTNGSAVSITSPKIEMTSEECSSTTTVATKSISSADHKHDSAATDVSINGHSKVVIDELITSKGGRGQDELIVKKEAEFQTVAMKPNVAGGRVKLRDVNPHLVCVLCHGYFVDATSIAECLHSFCRSCIILHLATKNYCPICRVQVNSSKPDLSLKPDKTLQDIVYKLVPELFHAEMKRRNQFYQDHPNRDLHLHPEFRGITVDRLVYSPHNRICLLLEYYDKSKEREDWDNVGVPLKSLNSNMTQSKNIECNEIEKSPKRYFNCPAAVRVADLKKLLSAKYSLDDQHEVDIIYRRESLPDDYSLMDIAYIYAWKRNSPMKIYYRIYIVNQVCEDSKKATEFVTESASDSSQPPIASEPSHPAKLVVSEIESRPSVVEDVKPSIPDVKPAISVAKPAIPDAKSCNPSPILAVSSSGPTVLPNSHLLCSAPKAAIAPPTLKPKTSITPTSKPAVATPKPHAKPIKTLLVDLKNKPKTTKSGISNSIPTPVPAGLNTSPMKSYLEISSIMNNVQPSKSTSPVEKGPLKTKIPEMAKESKPLPSGISKPGLTTTLTKTTETTWSVSKASTHCALVKATTISTARTSSKPIIKEESKPTTVAPGATENLGRVKNDFVNANKIQDKPKATINHILGLKTGPQEKTKISTVAMAETNKDEVKTSSSLLTAGTQSVVGSNDDKTKLSLNLTEVHDRKITTNPVSTGNATTTTTLVHSTTSSISKPSNSSITTTASVSSRSKTMSPISNTSSQAKIFVAGNSAPVPVTKELSKPIFTSMSKAAASKVVCVSKSLPGNNVQPVNSTNKFPAASEPKTSVPSSLPPLITLTSTNTTLTPSMSSLKIPSSLEISLTPSKSTSSSPSPVADLQKMVHREFSQVNGFSKDAVKRSNPEDNGPKEKYPCYSTAQEKKNPTPTLLSKDKKIALTRGEISVSTNDHTPTKKIFNPNILPEVSITVNTHPESANKRLSPERSYDVSCSFKPYASNTVPALKPINSMATCNNIQKSPIKSLINRRSSEGMKTGGRSVYPFLSNTESDAVKRNGGRIENGLVPAPKKLHLENGGKDNGNESKSEEKPKKELVARHQGIPQLIDINAPYAKSRLKLANAAAANSCTSNSSMMLTVKPPPPLVPSTSSGTALDLSSPTSKSPEKPNTFSPSSDKKKLIPSVPPQMIPVTMVKGDSRFSLSTGAKSDSKTPSPRVKSDHQRSSPLPSKSSPVRKDSSPKGVKLSPTTSNSILTRLMPQTATVPTTITAGTFTPDLMNPLSLNYLRQQQWLMNMRCQIPPHPLLFLAQPNTPSSVFQHATSNGVKK